jgi:hypothetical protein
VMSIKKMKLFSRKKLPKFTRKVFLKSKAKLSKSKSKSTCLITRPIDNYVVGVNFEAGKIIDNVRHLPNCLAYANCQISMDAPFSDRVADDAVRTVGRSELAFVSHGYDEAALIMKFREIVSSIKDKYLSQENPVKLVIQVARGKAAKSTIKDIIEPVLAELEISNYQFVIGYRSADYYNGAGLDDFVFLNYGMFGVLTKTNEIGVGEICNPVVSYSIALSDGPETLIGKNGSNCEASIQQTVGSTFDNDPKNILNDASLGIRKIVLFGIEDSMPFITPDKYKYEDFCVLIDKCDLRICKKNESLKLSQSK